MLKKGDPAPAFEGTDQNGEIISLESFRGKKLVLYFYPKDNTPGCTAEACSLRDGYQDLLKKGYAVVGVSADNANSHKKFIEKYTLPFPLIADTEKKMIQAYQAWGPKKFMGKSFDGIIRTTFLISEKGIIEEVISKVETKNHAEQILKINS